MLAGAGSVTYRKVMRTRATSKITLRSSHRRTIALRVSHTSPGHAWQPPVKDGDDDDSHGAPHAGGQKKRKNRR